MEDLSALASRIAITAGELQGCLVLSRDGLVLGAYPPEAETALKPAWLRFAGLGEGSAKGFIEFGDEIWAFVRRGPYAAFAVAAVNVRPGVLLDHMEQALLTAEEGRSKRDSFRIPDAAAAPSGKPRTSLHKDPRATPAQPPASSRPTSAPPQGPSAPRPAPAVASAAAQAAASRPAPAQPAPAQPPQASPVTGSVSPSAGAAPEPSSQAAATPAQGGLGPPASGRDPVAPMTSEPLSSPQEPVTDSEPEEEGEVDRVLLAQEFSRLLQESGPGDEA
jgi:hypothetical protein